MSTAIAIEGLTKRFGSVVAVDGLDLRVPRGSLQGFMLMRLGWPCGRPLLPGAGRALGGHHHPDREGHRRPPARSSAPALMQGEPPSFVELAR
ncbi:MAG: hypothetical protein WBX00_02685 [Isosphaeraceae bacterium]